MICFLNRGDIPDPVALAVLNAWLGADSPHLQADHSNRGMVDAAPERK